jgi:hypothetical protein
MKLICQHGKLCNHIEVKYIVHVLLPQMKLFHTHSVHNYVHVQYIVQYMYMYKYIHEEHL